MNGYRLDLVVKFLEVHNIASLTCTNASVVSKLKTMKVHTFHETVGGKKDKQQIEVFSILKIHTLH